MDSTANVLGATLQDNRAIGTLGGSLRFEMSNVFGAPGQPLAILYSPQGPTGPLPLGSSSVYLNLSGPLIPLIDGTGFFRQPPDLFAAHPGPSELFISQISVPEQAALHGSCFSFQGIVLDAAALFGIRVSNALSLGLVADLRFPSANHGPEGGTASVVIPGSGAGQLHYPVFDPLGAPATLTSALVSSGVISIPIGVQSGRIGYEDAATPGIISATEPGRLDGFFAVTDPLGLQPNLIPGTLVTHPSPSNPRDRWASITANLASAQSTQGWSLNVVAGETLVVECFSLSNDQSRVLDGWGRGSNPFASQGFDPLLRLEHGSNVLPLTFDAGSSGPFLVAGDDDGGVGGNARLVYQVCKSDILHITVASALASSFASGRYLLNVRIRGGAPCVEGFSIQGNTANLAIPGQVITIHGATIQAGGVYDVLLRPVHGFTADFVVPLVPATVNTQLSFSVPGFAQNLSVGAHRVLVRDLSTGETSLPWPTTFATQMAGILPEILVLRAQNPQGFPSPGQISTLIPNTTTVLGSGAVGTVAGLFSFAAAPGQSIYTEMLALDPGSQGRLVDAFRATSNSLDYVLNPQLLLWDANGLPTLLATNDNDGVLPQDFGWPGGGAVGIGWNAAIRFTASSSFNPASYLLSASEALPLGPGILQRSALVQLVIR